MSYGEPIFSPPGKRSVSRAPRFSAVFVFEGDMLYAASPFCGPLHFLASVSASGRPGSC